MTGVIEYQPKVIAEVDLSAADFSDALMWLKEGKRVCRSGWNGRGQWTELVKKLRVSVQLRAD